MKSHHHYIAYKPYGYLSQFIANGKVKQKHRYLGELHDFAEGTMSIGRLDYKSEGLLLLTTNGKISHEINSNKFEKEYWVQVDGEITPIALSDIRSGIDIKLQNGSMYRTKPCQIERIKDPRFPERNFKKVRDDRHGPSTWIRVVIKEGKFRQVRKMTAAVGFPTLRLVRVRVGRWTLDGLGVGSVQEVQELI